MEGKGSCLGRVPYNSVIGFILVFVGGGVLCGSLHYGMSKLDVYFRHNFFPVYSLQYLRITAVVFGALAIWLALLVVIFSVLVTNATRGRIYRGDRFTMGGRVSAVMFMTITYVAVVVWLVFLVFLVVPTFCWIMFNSICATELADVWHGPGARRPGPDGRVAPTFEELRRRNEIVEDTYVSRLAYYYPGTAGRSGVGFLPPDLERRRYELPLVDERGVPYSPGPYSSRIYSPGFRYVFNLTNYGTHSTATLTLHQFMTITYVAVVVWLVFLVFLVVPTFCWIMFNSICATELADVWHGPGARRPGPDGRVAPTFEELRRRNEIVEDTYVSRLAYYYPGTAGRSGVGFLPPDLERRRYELPLVDERGVPYSPGPYSSRIYSPGFRYVFNLTNYGTLHTLFDHPIPPQLTNTTAYHKNISLTFPCYFHLQGIYVKPWQYDSSLNYREAITSLEGFAAFCDEIEPDEVLVSFDVNSMYTNVPKADAVEVARRLLLADTTLQERTQVSVDKIAEGIKACPNLSHFVFDSIIYSQEQGLAMGSPIPPILANMYMEDFEQKASNGFVCPPRVFWRYVDDTFVVIKRDESDGSPTQRFLRLNLVSLHLSQVALIGPLFACSLGGAIFVLMGLTLFIGSLSGFYARLKLTKELTDFKQSFALRSPKTHDHAVYF
ncbi:hypothetical protein T265_08048 [Opisthorchis viverrini]|uniref:Reverse transcriptase domain-containing protein n=1 Tax=Opisthorchis viverrini TaxID=6198 RepID=A0A074ZAF3_OPIVI|nr:hypothetical protein T265_08048 [Opisthorchis viverrini]KER24256.1 hypothetical protein T265_08048 [Opisthorchis viverrini]